ncbi:MAG: DNA-binding response regulator [Chloroflexi bacterium]|nr:DNA-binding response regulator [Chloroflexota bacterium]
MDDDRDLVEVMAYGLRRAGFEAVAVAAFDPPAVMNAMMTERPALAVIDVNIGEWDGFHLVEEVRRTSSLPIIMLTARSAEGDRIFGLNIGADDYLTKPFSYGELVARIRAVLRRKSVEIHASDRADDLLSIGPVAMDRVKRRVTVDGRPINLSVNEFRLLRYLMRNAGAPVAVSEIVQQLWGADEPNGADQVRMAIHRLRRKLEVGGGPQLLHTVAGMGYTFSPE